MSVIYTIDFYHRRIKIFLIQEIAINTSTYLHKLAGGTIEDSHNLNYIHDIHNLNLFVLDAKQRNDHAASQTIFKLYLDKNVQRFDLSNN